MPEQAVALKKYRGGMEPGASKISDKEHTAPSLRDGTRVSVHSDVLSVQDSPGTAIPEFDQRPEDGAKVPSSVR
jgi:hypothetical protein